MAEKTIDIASPILSRNERLADQLRQRFNEAGTFVINVLSSPGSGKTTTILAPTSACVTRPAYAVPSSRAISPRMSTPSP